MRFANARGSTISLTMTEQKPSAETKNNLWKNQYQEPGETPGRREGLTPTGETLEEINTKVEEKGGYRNEEPTRYGDWTSNGRCTDF